LATSEAGKASGLAAGRGMKRTMGGKEMVVLKMVAVYGDILTGTQSRVTSRR
jgi:hypothetical protein